MISIKIEINEETGQNLMHGMGELHLEIIENRIRTEKKVEVRTSQPIVVYRETVMKPSPEVAGKSPNKHNVFFMIVEPLELEVYEAIKKGVILFYEEAFQIIALREGQEDREVCYPPVSRLHSL